MPNRLTNLIAAVLLPFGSAAVAQDYVGPVGASGGTFGVGSPVDRNVGDTGANAASQRVVQPGLGQFGVGSLLLDRFDTQVSPFEPFNPIVGDTRVNPRHRYLLRAPGVTALLSRPDYIGPSPNGGLAFNRQTIDGTEALAFSADTVFVLSPELLAQPTRSEPAPVPNHPNLIGPAVVGDPYAIMRDTIVTGKPQAYTIENHPAVEQDPNYVHPEILERRRRWKAEREAARQAEEGRADDEVKAEAKDDPEAEHAD